MPKARNETKRTILVAVAGGSPAIVTETLWALTKERAEPVRIDEVRILTTAKGKAAILETLLHRKNGRFKSCVQELEIAHPITFNTGTIHVFDDGKGGKLDDIRSDDDNKLAADQICNSIREWTREDTRLVRSVAGGRKTMSAYLAIRVVQNAVIAVIEPRFEKEFESCSFAYRKGRSVKQALQQIEFLHEAGYAWVLDADITSYFTNVDHGLLMARVSELVTSKRIVKLIQQWIGAKTASLSRLMNCLHSAISSAPLRLWIKFAGTKAQPQPHISPPTPCVFRPPSVSRSERANRPLIRSMPCSHSAIPCCSTTSSQLHGRAAFLLMLEACTPCDKVILRFVQI